MLALGVLRLARLLLRPISAPLLAILAVRLRHRRPVLAAFFGALGARDALGLLRDPVLRRSAGIAGAGPAAGLHHMPGTVMSQILKLAALGEVADLRPPRWLWNGDLTTLRTLGYNVPRPAYRRVRIALGAERAPVSVDVAMPVVEQPVGAIIVAAGVGGDSEAQYVKDLANAALREGYVVFALLPRGLGATDRVADLHDFFDPTDLQSLHLVVGRICEAVQLDTFLVGFSLGACMLASYFARFTPPPRVLGGVALAGAFRTDFMDWWRYCDFYQAFIVPSVVMRIFDNYSDELAGLFTNAELSALAGCKTYKDFHRRLAVRVGAVADYEEWKRACSANDPKTIDRPFLLFSCLDDPLHDPESIGVELPVDNANVAVCLTPSGGHVSSPTGLSPSSYHLLTAVALKFCRATRDVQARE